MPITFSRDPHGLASLWSFANFDNNPALGLFYPPVTWGELIRRLKAAGFQELRSGKGSHRQFLNPKTGQTITVAVHTKKEVGTGLANRILRDAGLK